MPLEKTIALAADAIGGQNKLAETVGLTSGNLSDIKKGRRHCPLAVRARIAHIAGLDPKLEMIEALTEELSGTDPFEAELRDGLNAILAAFPQGKAYYENQNKE